ncbi:hypothetical protein HKCCE3408_17635 [Rhodobacterales bacterium HKCCE3408]|nr:hypothetical protein [Rhodobacterales bacterium HKCCE3408]
MTTTAPMAIAARALLGLALALTLSAQSAEAFGSRSSGGADPTEQPASEGPSNRGGGSGGGPDFDPADAIEYPVYPPAPAYVPDGEEGAFHQLIDDCRTAGGVEIRRFDCYDRRGELIEL